VPGVFRLASATRGVFVLRITPDALSPERLPASPGSKFSGRRPVSGSTAKRTARRTQHGTDDIITAPSISSSNLTDDPDRLACEPLDTLDVTLERGGGE
jgi:hypothetical protein